MNDEQILEAASLISDISSHERRNKDHQKAIEDHTIQIESINKLVVERKRAIDANLRSIEELRAKIDALGRTFSGYAYTASPA